MILKNTLKKLFNATCRSTPRPNHYSDWLQFFYSALIHYYLLKLFYFFLIPNNSSFEYIFISSLDWCSKLFCIWEKKLLLRAKRSVAIYVVCCNHRIWKACKSHTKSLRQKKPRPMKMFGNRKSFVSHEVQLEMRRNQKYRPYGLYTIQFIEKGRTRSYLYSKFIKLFQFGNSCQISVNNRQISVNKEMAMTV